MSFNRKVITIEKTVFLFCSNSKKEQNSVVICVVAECFRNASLRFWMARETKHNNV